MQRWIGIVVLAALATGCDRWGEDADPYDLDFDIPRSETFPLRLSAYGLFAEPASALEPAAGVFLYELSSELYTDQAHKQRLLMVPDGAQVSVLDGETWRTRKGPSWPRPSIILSICEMRPPPAALSRPGSS